MLPRQQQQQQALGIVPQQQHQQQHHHLSSCMSTVQLKSTAERDNRRNHQVYTSSPVKQENHKSTDHGSEMYEISPYATFSVPGKREPFGHNCDARLHDAMQDFWSFGEHQHYRL
ncbi:uncharacterized protein [Temnothorax longispinosus]|uniref:uncharacterized protein n=1 Tax=Temnothorax longispinosus TaxID=300112 RepID=UPI003A99990E